MANNLDKKWYVAKIKPNSYYIAIQNLERQGFKTFLPKMKITERKRNKFVVKSTYVFPGYIFVYFDKNDPSWTKINSTYGVSKILAFNNKPSEIQSDLILALKNKYEINSNSTYEGNLKKGDSIKFYMGPFADFIGRIENIEENDRIWVILEGMGGYRRLRLQNSKKIIFNKF